MIALEKKILLREEVKRGFITTEIRKHLQTKIEELDAIDSKSWDRKFIHSILKYDNKNKLSVKQIAQLDRILSWEIIEQEYPNGIDHLLNDILIHNGQENESTCQRKHISKNKDQNDMIIIYNEITVFEGEDAYLGDGIWIRADGSTYDEKE